MNSVLNTLGLCAKAGKLVTGEDGVVDAIKKGKVHLVILASDAGKNTSKKIKDKSLFYNIKVINNFTIDEISHSIGKLNRVVIGIKDKGFKELILKQI